MLFWVLTAQIEGLSAMLVLILQQQAVLGLTCWCCCACVFSWYSHCMHSMTCTLTVALIVLSCPM